MRRSTRLLLPLLAAVLLATIASAIALAQGTSQLGGKVRYGDNVTVGQGETVATDLYAAGGTVSILGTVNGDVVAAAGQVTVDGTVTGDVIAAGGQVRIGGTVKGDVRAAGGQLTISGQVAEDALAAGGQVEVTSGATIGQDLIMSAGRATVDGNVTGNVTGSAAVYDRRGTVGGSDTVVVTGAPTGFVFERTPSSIVLDAIRHYLAVLLFGILLLWLARPLVARAEAAIRQRPLPVVGLGIVGLLGYVVLIVVIFVVAIVLGLALGILGFADLVGLVIAGSFVLFGVLTLAFIVAIVYLADAIVGLALARLIVPGERGGGGFAVGRRPDLGRDVMLLAVGAAVIVILASLPIVGAWVKLIVVIVGLGALLYALFVRPRRRPAEEMPVEPMPTA